MVMKRANSAAVYSPSDGCDCHESLDREYDAACIRLRPRLSMSPMRLAKDIIEPRLHASR